MLSDPVLVNLAVSEWHPGHRLEQVKRRLARHLVHFVFAIVVRVYREMPRRYYRPSPRRPSSVLRRRRGCRVHARQGI